MSVDKETRLMNQCVLYMIKSDGAGLKRKRKQLETAVAPRTEGTGQTYQPYTVRIREEQQADGENDAAAKNAPRNCIAAYLEENHIREGEKRIDIAYRSGLGKDEYDNFRSNAAWPDEDLLWKLFYGVFADYDGDIEDKLEEWRALNRRYWAEHVELVPDGAVEPVMARTVPKTVGKFRNGVAAHELLAYLYACLPDTYKNEQEIYQTAHVAPVTWAQLRENYYRHAWSEGVLVRAAHAAQMDEEETRKLFELAVSCRTLRDYMMEAILLMENRPYDPDEMMRPLLMAWFVQRLDRQAKMQDMKKPSAAKPPKNDTLEKKVAPILLRWKESED